jgi:hypothetical protein
MCAMAKRNKWSTTVLQVRIELNLPAGTSVFGVEDCPPPGWPITNISNGGQYDAVKRKVKWGPLFLPFPAVLTYTITPPAGTGGEQCWTCGTISLDGTNSAICGDTCLTYSCCPVMKADDVRPACTDCSDCSCATCQDGRIELCELIGYACAWKRGCNDDLAGVTRAAYIWKNGECYCWNQAQQNWFPIASPPPAGGCCP